MYHLKVIFRDVTNRLWKDRGYAACDFLGRAMNRYALWIPMLVGNFSVICHEKRFSEFK